MRVRGVRGATQVNDNSVSEIAFAVSELLGKMISENGIQTSDLISIIFTATPDLNADFPAVAARSIGLGEVPLLCAVEIDVPGSLQRVVRVLMHVNSDKILSDIKHIYINGAAVLRKDLAQ
ncbi:MAG: chorismate mutase [Actinobacteria bacterium]|nr:chorismate mutase [Actinomycetota bacterium]